MTKAMARIALSSTKYRNNLAGANAGNVIRLQTGPVRRRHDPRRDSTRARIIECAEEMFAELGIEAVPLRQIRLAIGSANSSVVAYHFGTKQELVSAILDERLPRLEARRAELLAIADRDGLGNDLRSLQRVQCLPLLEMTNFRGRHGFAGFLRSVSRDDWMQLRTAIDRSCPVTREIERRITSLLPRRALVSFEERMFAAIAIITTAIQRVDQVASDDGTRAESLFEDAVRMMTAVLTA